MYQISPEHYPSPTTPQSPPLNFQREPSHAICSLSTPASYLSPPIIFQYIFNIDASIPFDAQTPENQASLSCEWNRYLPDLGIVQLSRLEHDVILFRCFNYGASWLSGLIPDLFLRDFIDCLKPETTHPPTVLHHYTPLLHCSLLAFGAAFSDNPNIRVGSTRAKFASHAKQWLDEEFGRSNPTLILSLALLSEYHYGIGERNAGYMYMGK
jgi:hypothetical protein